MTETAENLNEVSMAGGKASSSKGPAFRLIPSSALRKLAARFELGVERKKDAAWNALSKNQEVLLDKEFVIERTDHIINHALKLRDKLAQNDFKGIEEDDDASAIAWGGIFLSSAVDAMLEEKGRIADTVVA